MSKLLRLSVSAAVLMFLFAAQASAVIVVSDAFRDANRTQPAAPTYSENGVDSDADGDIESAWYRTGTGSTASVTAGHFVTTAGTGSSMTMTNYFTPEVAPVTLTNVGDSIVVAWTFKTGIVSTTSTGNQDLRIGLLNSPTAASRVSTDTSPGNFLYSGYASFLNFRGGTLGNATPMRTMEWINPAASAILGTAGNYGIVGTGATAVVGTTPGYADNTTYTFTMSVTKTAAGADISQSMVGGMLNTSGTLALLVSDAAPQPLLFDTFVVRPGTPELTSTFFDTTMFQVEFIAGTAIPEPALLPVLAAGLLGLTAVVRRRLR